MSEAVSSRLEGGVLTLSLDRAEEKNTLTPETLNGLGDGLKQAASDASVRVVVLTHTGNTFCAGNDLRGRGTEAPRYSLVDVFELMQSNPKPIVGLIRGHCMGGGVGLAAACDISLIAESARLGFTEVRIGVAPAMISVVCLPKMRRADAMELFLSGEKIPAQRAVEVGLLNAVHADAELDEALKALLDKLLRGGPNALAASKSLVYEVPQENTADAFKRTAVLSKQLFESDEAAAGMAAFRERKDAPWVQ